MKAGFAQQYAAFEREHWWFRARRVILRTLLAREISWRNGMEVLEVGVGPGENLYSVYPSGIRLSGLEPDEGNAQIARDRGAFPVYTGVIETLPSPLDTTQFDVITAFDVIEHIQDDRRALAILKERLKPGGRLVLTVPAYQWMWGPHDTINEHFRRYTLGELRKKLNGGGYHVRRASYFNTVLFPPIAAVRLLGRLRKQDPANLRSDCEVKAGLFDPLLYGAFVCEAGMLKHVSFPFGVSAFVVAESGSPVQPTSAN